MTREGGVQSLGPFFAEPAIEFASPMSLFHSGGLDQSGPSRTGRLSLFPPRLITN